ncbi:hypothetical protein BLNAU_16568 [Blattamonas nauphoetae]|uniref:Uncharacterized protein n=1 Tax=Blattamonas nauphoetae TaxID=2049346 RepID=A0ABQ9X9X2_9EUKA|nr:hypothetical protein BLNAU_16568 [Blattamonas nauphoetae]
MASSVSKSYRFVPPNSNRPNLTTSSNAVNLTVLRMFDVLRLPDQTDYDYSIALGRQALVFANQFCAN